MNKQGRLLPFIIAFFLSVITGAVYAQQADNILGGARANRMKAELGLTAAQASKLEQLVLSGQKEIDSLRRQTAINEDEWRKQLEDASVRKQQAIQSLLTPEQRNSLGELLLQRAAGRAQEQPNRDHLRAQVLERLQKAGDGHAFKSMKQTGPDTLKRNN